MVLQHVARGARFVVVSAAAPLEPLRFGHRDLHVVDVIAIKERFEDGVAEAEQQDVLHRLFAEIVIDPVDLLLGEIATQVAGQCLGGRQVVAVRLFENDTQGTIRVGRRNHSRLTHRFDSRHKQIGRRRQVGDLFALHARAAFDLLEILLQTGEFLRVLDVGAVVEQALGEVTPLLIGKEPRGDFLFDGLGHLGAERIVGFFAAGHADNRRSAR